MASNQWTKEEDRIIKLLLDGDADFIQALARQVKPPLLQKLIRRHPRSFRKADRTEPTEYHWDLIFDESLLGQYSLGPQVNLHIDDLHIVEPHLGRQVQIVGQVNNGLLTRIIARSPQAVRWPRRVKVEDWWYILDTAKGPWKSKRRAALQGLPGPHPSQQDDSLPVATPVGPRNAEEMAEQLAADPSQSQFEQIVEEVVPAIGEQTQTAQPKPHVEPRQQADVPSEPEAQAPPAPAQAEEPPAAPEQIADILDDDGLADEPAQRPRNAFGDRNEEIRDAMIGAEGVVQDDTGFDETPTAGPDVTWVRQFLTSSFDGGEGVNLRRQADEKDLAGLAEAFGGPLPEDLADWLRCGDGGILWGHTLLSCDEMSVLGEEDQLGQLVAFALDARGGAWALDLANRRDGSCPVVKMDRSGGGKRIAESFSGWLSWIESRASSRST